MENSKTDMRGELCWIFLFLSPSSRSPLSPLAMIPMVHVVHTDLCRNKCRLTLLSLQSLFANTYKVGVFSTNA